MPHNLEAEQALLGALMFDNAVFERLSDRLRGAHFYEPFHQRLFDAIEDHIRQGHAGRADHPDGAVQTRPGLRGTRRPALPRRPGRPRAAGRQRARLRPRRLRPGPAPRPDPHRRRDHQGGAATPRRPPTTRSNRPNRPALHPGRDRQAVVGLRHLLRRPARRRRDGGRGLSARGQAGRPVHRSGSTSTRSWAACTPPTC